MDLRDGTRPRDPSVTIGRNIEPFLLFELLLAPSYGYDLIRRLSENGFRRASAPGDVYKVLRSLEDSGSIRSEWSTQASGPARRYYEITEQGQELLRHRVTQLKRHVDRVQQLLARYSAFTGESLAVESPDLEPVPSSAVPTPQVETILARESRGRQPEPVR